MCILYIYIIISYDHMCVCIIYICIYICIIYIYMYIHTYIHTYPKMVFLHPAMFGFKMVSLNSPTIPTPDVYHPPPVPSHRY